MTVFHDLTLDPGTGLVREHRQYDSAALPREGVALLQRTLMEGGQQFQKTVPLMGRRGLDLKWTAIAPGAAMATFFKGNNVPLVTCALVAGIVPPADLYVLQQLAQLRVMVLSKLMPSIKLVPIEVAERPSIIILPMLTGESFTEDMQLAARLESLLAAAAFEGLETEENT